MEGISYKRKVAIRIAYIRAVPESATEKGCCLICNSLFHKRIDSVAYVREKEFFIERAKIWSNIDIPNDDSFHYFTEVYCRITSNYGNRNELP